MEKLREKDVIMRMHTAPTGATPPPNAYTSHDLAGCIYMRMHIINVASQLGQHIKSC